MEEEIERLRRNDPGKTTHFLHPPDFEMLNDPESMESFVRQFTEAVEGNTYLEELVVLITGITVHGMNSLVTAINGLPKMITLKIATTLLLHPDGILRREEAAFKTLFSKLKRDKLETIALLFYGGFPPSEDISFGPAGMNSISSFFSETTSLARFEVIFRNNVDIRSVSNLLSFVWKGLETNVSLEVLVLTGELSNMIDDNCCAMLKSNNRIRDLEVVSRKDEQVSTSAGNKLVEAIKNNRGLGLHLGGVAVSLCVCRQLRSFEGISRLGFFTESLDVRLAEALAQGAGNVPVESMLIVYRERTCATLVGDFLAHLADFAKNDAKVKGLALYCKETTGVGQEQQVSSQQESAALANGFAAFAEALVLNPDLKRLCFTGLGLDDECAKIFGAALPRMNGLRAVRFEENQFSEVGRAAVVDGFERNYTLESIDGIDICGLEEETPDLIASRALYYTSRNSFGTHSFLSSSPLSLWPHMMQSLDRIVSRSAEQDDRGPPHHAPLMRQITFSVKHYLIRERIDLLLANRPRASNSKKRKFGAE